MSDKVKQIFGEGPSDKAMILNQAANYMARGAGYGLVFFVAVLVGFWVLVQVGKVLPEDSKEMPDPINRGAIEAPVTGAEIRTV